MTSQTGLRLSELVGLDRDAVHLGSGAHVRCLGKGRKERATPLTQAVHTTLQTWLGEPARRGSTALFPTVHGARMSSDAVQYLLAKYVAAASTQCPSLARKSISPHVLRHSAAMALLDAGVDTTVISLWLGHKSTRSTQPYLHAHLAVKEAALAKVAPMGVQGHNRFRADDQLLGFFRRAIDPGTMPSATTSTYRKLRGLRAMLGIVSARDKFRTCTSKPSRRKAGTSTEQPLRERACVTHCLA